MKLISIQKYHSTLSEANSLIHIVLRNLLIRQVKKYPWPRPHVLNEKFLWKSWRVLARNIPLNPVIPWLALLKMYFFANFGRSLCKTRFALFKCFFFANFWRSLPLSPVIPWFALLKYFFCKSWSLWKTRFALFKYFFLQIFEGPCVKYLIESSYSMICAFENVFFLQILEGPCAKHDLRFWGRFFLQILEGLCASYSRQPLFPIRRKPLGNIVSILYGTMLFSYLDFVSHHHPTSDICGCIFYRKDELERAGWSFRDGYALHQFSLERGKIEQTFERKNTTGKFN